MGGKFNKKANISTSMGAHLDAIKNHEGALAFDMSAKTKLMTIAVTNLIGEQKYYESANAVDVTLSLAVDAVLRIDPEFILKLAAFCRNQMYLRSLPIYLLVKYANFEGKSEVPNATAYVPQIVKRADELTEVVAAQKNMHPSKKRSSGGVKLPRVLKNGLALAFNNFSEYQIAKYNRDGEIKLRDVLFLTHPKPKNERQQQVFDKLAANDLAVPDTWEVNLSNWQGRFESKKASWHYVINHVFWDEGRVANYMAMLRNLRNMLEEDIDLVDIQKVAGMLQNAEAIAYAKQFPYRFLSAYKTVQAAGGSSEKRRILLNAIESALVLSIQNIPKMTGSTLVLIDISASMESPVSRKSTVLCSDIATVFGVMTPEIVEKRPTVCAFGSYHRYIRIDEGDQMLETARKIQALNRELGHGTNLKGPLDEVRKKKIHYDRIILLSDMQCHRYGAEALELYRREVNPECFIYSVDLHGYGTAVAPENQKNFCIMGGYSDKIFDFISNFEADKATMLGAVEAWSPN